MKKKGFIMKALLYLKYKQRGAILNAWNSIISPEQYYNETSPTSSIVIEQVISILAPSKFKNGHLKVIGGKKMVAGGWDGSYVIPQFFLRNLKLYLISAGIDKNNQFEIEIANYGINGIQIDNSIDQPPQNHINLKFIRKTLCGQDTHNSISLKTLISKCPKNLRLLVKLDIEGSERNSLLSLNLEDLRRIEILILEIHDLSRLFEIPDILKMLTHLKSAGFRSIFVKPNNRVLTYNIGGYLIPDCIEITFVNQIFTQKPNLEDIVKIKKLITPNDLSKAQINIDHILYRHAEQKSKIKRLAG
jgi:hypothetical protein